MYNKETTRLKSLLKRHHMTQQDFADWFYISKDAAFRIINGKRQLKADEIVKICMRFDVSADWLLELSDEKRPWEEDDDV